jgi:4-amino-4-deoxy-L-arabinose transferase-like glycosyltransferase
MLLSVVYRAVGVHVTAGRLLNVVVGVAVVVLILVVGTQWFGRRVGLVAGGIAAVYPPLLLADTSLMSEPLALLLLLGALALVKHSGSPTTRWGWAVLATGLLLGAALLTRPITLVAVPVFVAMVLQQGRSPNRVRMVALLAVGIVAVLLPWETRNLTTFDTTVLLTTQTGPHLAGVYNDTVRNDTKFPAQWRPANLDPTDAKILADHQLNEPRLDAALRTQVGRFIRAHPTYVARVAYYNVRRLLGLGGWQIEKQGVQAGYGQRGPQAALELLAFWLVAAAAIAGLSLRHEPRDVLLWLVPLCLAVPAILITAEVRFRQPLEPFFVLAAALALVRVAPVTRRRDPVITRPNTTMR